MLDKTYAPQQVENRIYRFWEDNQLFRPEVNPPDAPTFSMVIPPPNVTGTLHMGHALDNTLQDILTRWHRMRGFRTLWMPGTDHAGIATQNVVERGLREGILGHKGQTKHDLGREAFLEIVWDWANARKGDITGQFRRLGISPDWSRERFTLDEGCSEAVKAAFVTLYNKGLIYKGTYIVNWCPRCTSAISDIETEYEEEDSFLWEISYPLASRPGAIVVATTRPETMFGDVAVAVNPNDARFKNLIGETVVLPLSNVEIPIIADEHVEMGFGTGALKITPAHDPNDFEIAQRHGLEAIWVIDESGTLKAIDRVPSDIQGMDRTAARKKTETLLELHGFLRNKTPHKHSVGHCQRCNTTIEPLLSQQWFVKCSEIAPKMLKSLEAGELKFVPERWTKIYRDWLENMRDWCISRQLWWGHQIPAWTCQHADCGKMTVATDTPSACSHCGHAQLVQETDVLDTWFSSGLWPFSTMGWPNAASEDLKNYYPTNVLVTGFDIIFFWVARMVLFGLELTGQSPFETVYIHGLIRDEKGQKMSKSKGNTIDPVEVIDAVGCDALRFSLTNLVTGGQDIKMSSDSFDQGKLFANKLWNASRFVLMNLEDADADAVDETQLSNMDRWIRFQLRRCETNVNTALAAYRFSDVTSELYEFIWNDFCDWYVEYAKKQLRDPATKTNTQRVLRDVLDGILRLLHPVMPHITEEIWQKLPFRHEVSLMICRFPAGDAAGDTTLEAGIQTHVRPIQTVQEAIRTIRNVRQSSGVPLSQKTDVILETANAPERAALEANEDVLHHFLKLDSLTFTDKLETVPAGAAIGVTGQMRVIVPLAGIIDTEAEVARQQKKREALEKEHQQLAGRLGNTSFVERAPAAVVEKDRARMDELTQQIAVIDEQLNLLLAGSQ